MGSLPEIRSNSQASLPFPNSVSSFLRHPFHLKVIHHYALEGSYFAHILNAEVIGSKGTDQHICHCSLILLKQQTQFAAEQVGCFFKHLQRSLALAYLIVGVSGTLKKALFNDRTDVVDKTVQRK